VAKFQGDRSRELGERVAKKKKTQRKTSRAFYKSSRTTVTGGIKTSVKHIRIRLIGGCVNYHDITQDLNPACLAANFPVQ